MKIILLLLAVAATQQTCNDTSAPQFFYGTSQAWSGGAAGSGHGTYYRMYVKADLSKVTFDSLWVNEKRIPVTVKQNETKSDTLVLSAEDFVRGMIVPDENGQMQPPDETKIIPLPISDKVSAVLGYMIDGHRMYIAISGWKRLPMLAYP